MQYFCSDIDMIRIFTRRKRLLTIILLTMFIALGARAQDDEDIAHSLNLTEVVVLADGMTFEEYLLKQVLAHAKPLKERTKSLRYTVTCQVEKDMDLNKFPHRRTITFAARLAGYGPIVSALREHKHFGITVAEDVMFQNGKMTTSKARMVEMKQKLTDKQIASFLKHDWMLSTNMYDKFYKMVRDKVKDLQKMRKKKRDDVDFRYVGSYTSGNRTFYIVKLDNVRVHIADGCWQISRMSYHEGQNDMQYEFKEIKPDLFLLSHGKAKLYIDKEKWPQGFVSLKLDYDYR